MVQFSNCKNVSSTKTIKKDIVRKALLSHSDTVKPNKFRIFKTFLESDYIKIFE